MQVGPGTIFQFRGEAGCFVIDTKTIKEGVAFRQCEFVFGDFAQVPHPPSTREALSRALFSVMDRSSLEL